MTDRVAIGVIGCGFFSRNHLNSWKDLAPQGADLVAVCDIDAGKAKAAAEAFGVPHWYTDAETMFRERQLGLVDIVTRMDTPSLRLAKRYVAELAERGVPVEDLVILANRYGQSGLVNWKKAEESLRRKVAAWLPDDPGSVNAALRDGRPLVEVAPRAGLTRELNRVAAELQARFAPASR